MPAKMVSKKKYLKILNDRLRAEEDVSFGALFVFHPLGSRARHAKGVTASEPSGRRELAVMAEIQRIAAAEFIVAKPRDRIGNGRKSRKDWRPSMAQRPIESYKGAQIVLVQERDEATCTGRIRYRDARGHPVTKDVMGPQSPRFGSPEDMVAAARAEIDELARMGAIHEPQPPT